MNALATAASARPERRGLTARRWLIVLVALQGVAALLAAVALALAAPTAGSLLGGTLGSQATAAALLLAVLSGTVAVASFAATGSLLRDRLHAELTAGGIQATFLVGGGMGLISAGMLPELIVATAVGVIGLLLVALSAGSSRR